MMLNNPLGFAADCIHSGDYSGAERACRQILELDPGVGEAWFVLGVASQLLGKIPASVTYYRNSVRLAPGNPEAWNNLGASLSNLRRSEEAEPCLRRALVLEPAYAQAHNNLGNALQAQGRCDEALESYHRALALKPDYFEVYEHVGLVLQCLGRLHEALDWLKRAVEKAPEQGSVHMNYALTCLQGGEFEQGWTEYEWRFRCREHPILAQGMPLWDGSPLDGHSILLWAEQGLGDTIQFIRYAHAVAHRGGRVIVACPRSLLRIAATCQGVFEVIPEGTDQLDCACHAPLMSLPRIFGTTLDSIPSKIPYLAADPALASRWSDELGGFDGFKIGIAWQGNPDHKKDRYRSFPFARFEALASIPGCTIFALQKGPGAEQIETLGGRFPVINLGGQLDDFADTAAVLEHLDLVITPDTSLAHLAGALGVPVWVAIPFASDWRWLLEREDTPWYPTMRLFRQRKWGDWDDVFGRMARELSRSASDQVLRIAS
jgi:Flp pilus assembly protein TadD